MQALTLAISLTGLRYLTQYYLGGSIEKEPGSCFTQTVDQATVQALENIDFSSAVQNVLQNLFGTIPASGQLTFDIVFDFN